MAILVMWPGSFEKTFIPPSRWDTIWNLASICPLFFEEMFKECGWQTDGQQRPTYSISSSMVSLRLRWAKNHNFFKVSQILTSSPTLGEWILGQTFMECKTTLQGTQDQSMNAFWWVVAETQVWKLSDEWLLRSSMNAFRWVVAETKV